MANICIFIIFFRLFSDLFIIFVLINNLRNIFFSCIIQSKENYKNANVCHICEKDLNNDKVWNHCHINGKYFGAAHDNCNK